MVIDLRLKKLKVKNFRCFENLEMNLNSRCNVLVGINGSGKSTILDALSIALSGYLLGFDDIKGTYIQTEDAHFVTHQAGNRIEVQEQFPVIVYAEGIIDDDHDVKWQRELNGKDRRTTHGNARCIVDYAKKLQDAVRSGNMTCTLPLTAYYSTGRLWLQKRNRTAHEKGKTLKRQMGYIDCMAAASNEKQMLQWFADMTYIQLQEGRPIAELEAVKQAIRQCYMSSDPSISDAYFQYNVKNHELEVTIYRNDTVEKFPIRMLSDGEKGVISLVADIAYRMALLNPNLFERVLQTPGVVLVDEIDMHLHPSWQKRIMKDLMNIFPNVQFIVTTHSPSVLANIKEREYVQIVDHFNVNPSRDMIYGRSVEEILCDIMNTNVSPEEITDLQQEFNSAIDCEDFDKAQEILNHQRQLLGNNANAVIENQITLDVEMEM